MSAPPHSQTPWAAQPGDDALEIRDAYGHRIAIVEAGSPTDDQEVAGFILLAVNAHDELVAALRRARGLHAVRCNCGVCVPADLALVRVGGDAP